MTDQEKKDLAQSYQTMMDLGAWKHFQKIMDAVEFHATNDEDNLPIGTLNMAQVGECRGRRNAIRKIRADLNYILSGLQ